MSREPYEELLLREHDLAHRAEVAGLNRKKARFALVEAEQEVGPLGKLLPFWGKSEKAAIESAANRLEHWERKERDYEAKHDEVMTQLDVSTLTTIREQGAKEYLKGQKIKDFFSLARERVDVFRMHVRDFLKALGQARGAMSTGYNNANGDYSANAKERLNIALESARKLDRALSDLELLKAEFRSKANGTSYSKIKMPGFEQVNYEAGVRMASTLPIAQAQEEFEKTLVHCEQLHDQGIDDVIGEINTQENDHEDIMLEIVRGYWRDQQAKLLRDHVRVEEIRATLAED